jgi:molybdopterin synthase sulfur carrier subunit
VSIEVRLPGDVRVLGAGTTLSGLIDDLDRQRPGLREQLLDDSGLRRYLNVYVGGADVRYGDGLATLLSDGDIVTVLPAGAPERPA